MSENDKGVCLLFSSSEIDEKMIDGLELASQTGLLAGVVISDGENAKPDLLEKLKNKVGENGTAIMQKSLFGDVSQGYDGYFVPAKDSGAKKHYAMTKEDIGEDALLGVQCSASKHSAMLAGENGADFVLFSAVDEAELAKIVNWWQDMFFVPCIAFSDGSRTQLDALKSVGAEYIMCPYNTLDEKSPKDAVEYLSSFLG